MRTVFADFNAMTEAEQVCLTTRGSQKDIEEQGIQIGDHVWLSDGELLVGAEVAQDPRYGIVGVPAWDTLVSLDDAEKSDFGQAWSGFQELSQPQSRTHDEETRLLQLLATIERKAPQNIKEMIPPGHLAFRRAGALWSLGHLELALQEVEHALAESPGRQDYLYFHLELLRSLNPLGALGEARRLVEDPSTKAAVLTACINVLATYMDTLPDEQFEAALPNLVDWIERFRTATDIASISVGRLSLVWFNRGMAHLRRNQMDEARKSFSMMLQVNPKDQAAQRAIALDRYDALARQLAEAYRAKPVAAA